MPRSDKAIATALVALAGVVDESQLPAICDKALSLLAKSGSSSMHGFVASVVKVLQKSGQIVSAELITPTGSVGPARKASMIAALEKKFSNSVLLTEKADATLLGGARLRIGDDLYDCSLRGDLQKLALL
ncbi:hypothetical protein EXS65_03510 [Candidatus Peribacteria bacterium]|nr:hypothetical protein [Candidatus Peribacteria bacterium]